MWFKLSYLIQWIE
jgi:hypothetical protein